MTSTSTASWRRATIELAAPASPGPTRRRRGDRHRHRRSGLRAASARGPTGRCWRRRRVVAVLPVRFGTAMADDRAVVEELLAPRHDELVAHLAELAGKVQLTVKGDFDEERLLRGVVDALARHRAAPRACRGLPEAAAYYDRIRLGQLIAEEVEQARQHYAAPRGRAARAARGRHEHRARVGRRRRGERRVPGRAGPERGVQPARWTSSRRSSAARRPALLGPLPPYSFASAAPRSAAWA